jgi:hypothetical protein
MVNPKTYSSRKQVFLRTEKASEVSFDLKNTTILMYKLLIRPVLTYASKIWTLSKANKRGLSLFERKVLRCIFGVKQEKKHGKKDTVMNYTKYLMSQTLSITLTFWHPNFTFKF